MENASVGPEKQECKVQPIWTRSAIGTEEDKKRDQEIFRETPRATFSSEPAKAKIERKQQSAFFAWNAQSSAEDRFPI
jgi:hypothetical protein